MTTTATKKMTEVIIRSFKQTAFRLPIHLILVLDVEKLRHGYKGRDELVRTFSSSGISGRLSCGQGFEQNHA